MCVVFVLPSRLSQCNMACVMSVMCVVLLMMHNDIGIFLNSATEPYLQVPAKRKCLVFCLLLTVQISKNEPLRKIAFRLRLVLAVN